VYGESRFLAVDMTAERAGLYSEFLIARPARRAVLEARTKVNVIESQGEAGFGMFGRIVQEGRASKIRLLQP